MPKKIQLKTEKTEASVEAFLDTVVPEQLREDSYALLELFKRVTGMPAKMWGGSIIGFGEYTYFRANGDEGNFMATGFSPRKSGPTLYILPGYQDYADIMKTLGKYKLGKSCLYLKQLSDVDLSVLEELIKTGMADLKATHKTNY